MLRLEPKRQHGTKSRVRNALFEAQKGPIRVNSTMKQYLATDRTKFFRRLEALCTKIYDFQKLTIPTPPMCTDYAIAYRTGSLARSKRSREVANSGSLKELLTTGRSRFSATDASNQLSSNSSRGSSSRRRA